MVQESSLEPAARSFLLDFVPNDDGLVVKQAWLEQFITDVAQLKGESQELQAEFVTLKNDMLGNSDIDENEEMKALKENYVRVEQESLELKQQNNDLITKNVEERKRIQELNIMLQQIIQHGVTK